jgi:hypothetical protein
MYLRAELVFILEHHNATKLSPALRGAFISAYAGNEVPNMTTVHRLVTKFRDAGNVCL